MLNLPCEISLTFSIKHLVTAGKAATEALTDGQEASLSLGPRQLGHESSQTLKLEDFRSRTETLRKNGLEV